MTTPTHAQNSVFAEPTDYAIDLAIRNAAEQGHNYSVEPIGDTTTAQWGFCTVQHKAETNRVYVVDIRPSRPNFMKGCTCLQWEKAGVCKHEKMAHDFYQEAFAVTDADIEEWQNEQIETSVRNAGYHG